MNPIDFESLIQDKIRSVATADDPAHDWLHFERVVATAKKLCAEEGGRIEIVMPAAWLHDLVNVPKNDPRRNQASRLSAEAGVAFLKSIGYPEEHFEAIAHAIAAHSFSADIAPRTLEAAIVQDADRLDGLGAIGIARCFASAGVMRRGFYADDDPFCVSRRPDDMRYTVDHFFVKLFKTAETMKTPSGRREAERRARVMRTFLKDLESELGPRERGPLEA